ncbi:MAG: hypothetical protein AAGA16_19520 [Cyanobacteria bacterium P01_E01_bin.35]
MTLNNIAQTSLSIQSSSVYEYSLTVVNPENNDTQDLNAAFRSIPTSTDWQQWLDGWTDTGYELHSQPQLLQIF